MAYAFEQKSVQEARITQESQGEQFVFLPLVAGVCIHRRTGVASKQTLVNPLS